MTFDLNFSDLDLEQDNLTSIRIEYEDVSVNEVRKRSVETEEAKESLIMKALMNETEDANGQEAKRYL